MNDIRDFDEFEESNPLDTIVGSDENMLSQAVFLDTAAAMSEIDLMPEGQYPIHIKPGQYVVMIDKKPNGDWNVIFNAKNFLWEQWKADVELEKAKAEFLKKDAQVRVEYVVPQWALIMLMVTKGVHPDINEAAFEKVLYEDFPECWITPPKRFHSLII